MVSDRHECGELADVHGGTLALHLRERWSASKCSSCQIGGLCVYSQIHSRSDTPPMYRSIGPNVDPPSAGFRLRDPASPSRVFPVFAIGGCLASSFRDCHIAATPRRARGVGGRTDRHTTGTSTQGAVTNQQRRLDHKGEPDACSTISLAFPAPRSLRAVGCGGAHGGVRDRLDRSGDGRRPLRDVYGESAVVRVAADGHDLPSTVPLNSDPPGALVGRGIHLRGFIDLPGHRLLVPVLSRT